MSLNILKTLRKTTVFFAIPLVFATFSACMDTSNITYTPTDQKLPVHIKRVAVRPFTNKTPQFGLEEKVTLALSEELLKNGEYTVTTENNADGVLIGEITNYMLTPLQYDVNMVANVYKMNVIVSVRFLDLAENRYLWEEPALQATKVFSAAALPGGMTEESAREELWETLAKNITLRTVEGFGSISSISRKKLPPLPDGVEPGSPAAPTPEADNASNGGVKEPDR